MSSAARVIIAVVLGLILTGFVYVIFFGVAVRTPPDPLIAWILFVAVVGLALAIGYVLVRIMRSGE